MPRPVVLAVDCSTTASKAVAFGSDGQVVVESRRYLSRESPRPGWQEQDATEWWSSAADALAGVMLALGAQHRPVAVSVTNQRESFVCLDGRGVPVRPAVLWLDTRAGDQIARVGSEHVHRISGKPPSTTPSLYKLAWLAEHEPAAFARTAIVLDVQGYLLRHLVGRPVTSWASADSTGLLDMSSRTWDAGLVSAAGLVPEQLPELAAPGAVVGSVTGVAARRTGLPVGLPVVAGAGDGQCAGLGAGALGRGRAYLSLGTSLTLGVHADGYRWDRAYRTLASPLGEGYVLETLLSSGALSIAWFRDAVSGLEGERREERLEQLAAQVPPGAGGLLFLPYLTSAETPYWDPDARAAFVGLDDSHGRAEMYRALLEGLAFEKRLSLRRIEESLGTTVPSLTVMGGAAQSPLFTRILADVLERPVDLAAERETTALGAAILAAAAVGMDGLDDVLAAIGSMTRTAGGREPETTSREVYRQAASVYEELYPALQRVFGRLARLREVSFLASGRSGPVWVQEDD